MSRNGHSLLCCSANTVCFYDGTVSSWPWATVHGACTSPQRTERRPKCPWAALSPLPSSATRSSSPTLTLCEKGQHYPDLLCICSGTHQCFLQHSAYLFECLDRSVCFPFNTVSRHSCSTICYHQPHNPPSRSLFLNVLSVILEIVVLSRIYSLHFPHWIFFCWILQSPKYLYLFIFSPGSTVPSPCQRRLYMVTSMTPTTRRSIAAAPTCACVLTAWPCRMLLPRWRCSSSSAAGCQKWLCLPPSTAITWLRLRLEDPRI